MYIDNQIISCPITQAGFEHTRDTPKQECCEKYQIKIGSGRNLMVHGGRMNRARIKPVGDLWGLPLTE